VQYLGWIHLHARKVFVIILLQPGEGKELKANLSGTSPVDSKDESYWVSIPGVWVLALKLMT
jgi:hypothetical protein